MFEQNIVQGPGTGTFTTHTFEIIFMLLVAFLLGLWLGWVLWSRFRREVERLRVENVSLEATASALRSENDGLKSKLAEAETGRSAMESQLQNATWELENSRNQLTVLESDLEKLQERNRQLAAEMGLSQNPDTEMDKELPLDVAEPIPSEPLEEDLPDLEEVAGTENAELPLQDDRSESARAPYTPESIAPVVTPLEVAAAEEKYKAPETEAPVIATVMAGPSDDLKIVEGIGPKIEELLFQAGITTYGHLAATSVQQLQNILGEAGPRFAMHDPGTWSAQALLAANGEWENLKAYQEFLNAGKRPDKG